MINNNFLNAFKRQLPISMRRRARDEEKRDEGSEKREGRNISILDIPLGKGKSQIALSSFSYLFSEAVQQTERNTKDYDAFVKKLASLGKHIGSRVLE